MSGQQGWNQAEFSCGRCGHRLTAETEGQYVAHYAAHRDAHAVWDQLNPIERSGFGSILRTILAHPLLAVEVLELANREGAYETGEMQ